MYSLYMSIVVLKRKSCRYGKKISGGGFSKNKTGNSSTRLHTVTKRAPYGSDCDTYTNWVQSDNPQDTTQSSHIKKVKETAYSSGIPYSVPVVSSECNLKCKQSYMLGSVRKLRSTTHKDVPGAMTSDEYTKTRLLQKQCLPTIPSKAHFPMRLNKGCGSSGFYLTPEEAIAAGLLPSDWGGRISSISSNPICE